MMTFTNFGEVEMICKVKFEQGAKKVLIVKFAIIGEMGTVTKIVEER